MAPPAPSARAGDATVTGQNNRPGVGSRAAENAFRCAPTTVLDAAHPVTTTSRCVDCGRPLTAPASVARGIGPVCAERYRLESARSATAGLLARLGAVVESAPIAVLRRLSLALFALEQEYDALEAPEGVR